MSVERYKTHDGYTYRVRVDLGPDPVTRRRRQRKKAGLRTRKEADALEAAWFTDISRGVAVETVNTTFAVYTDYWLYHVARHTVRAMTLRNYTRWAKNYLTPQIGATPIGVLSVQQLQAWVSCMVDGGYAAKTTRCAAGLLREILGYAVNTKTLTANPATLVKLPPLPRVERVTWTEAQVRAFLVSAEGNPYRHAWYLALATGIRRGELLALRWRDYDRVASTLTIRGSLARMPGGLVIGEPKTPGSRRTLALSELCKAALAGQAAQQKRWQLQARDVWEQHDLIFTTHAGHPLDPEQLVRAFHALREKAGLPRLRFHDLRHTNATLLLQLGTNLKVVSERLGHANIQMTANTYSHVSLDWQRQAAETFDTMIKTGTGEG